jgi:hypothetical protein
MVLGLVARGPIQPDLPRSPCSRFGAGDFQLGRAEVADFLRPAALNPQQLDQVDQHRRKMTLRRLNHLAIDREDRHRVFGWRAARAQGRHHRQIRHRRRSAQAILPAPGERGLDDRQALVDGGHGQTLKRQSIAQGRQVRRRVIIGRPPAGLLVQIAQGIADVADVAGGLAPLAVGLPRPAEIPRRQLNHTSTLLSAGGGHLHRSETKVPIRL